MDDWQPEGRVPGEIVEYYHRPVIQEVVETYTQPQFLPGLQPVAPKAPGKKHKKTGLIIFLICCGVTLLLAAISFWMNGWLRPSGTVPSPLDDVPGVVSIPTYPSGQGAMLPLTLHHGTALSIQEVYRTANPAVVTVLAELGGSAGVSVGTGVIFTSDGYVLTNYHVVEDGTKCTVALNTGATFSALYVAGDRINDLAVLKVEEEGLPTATFGDSEDLTVGDTVYAIGNPLGLELRGTLTDGIVSAINRDVRVDGRMMTLIQTNAALNFGNSGGPLINVYGQVVGINTIKMSSSYSNVEGLGFAIPSASIEYMVNDLLSYGEVKPEPVVGVSVSQTGLELPDGKWGVEVFSVTPGTPAADAGILVGDILVSAGGDNITASRELLRTRNRYQVGADFPVTVWRDHEYLHMTLHLTMAAG